MTYFALEILANCTVHYESYFFGVYYIPVLCAGFYFFGGFYFWLDVISTASMIFDVHWLDVLACVEINQCVGCTRQFFTKSFLGDDATVLAQSSGGEPGIATPSSTRRVDGVENGRRENVP